MEKVYEIFKNLQQRHIRIPQKKELKEIMSTVTNSDLKKIIKKEKEIEILKLQLELQRLKNNSDVSEYKNVYHNITLGNKKK